MTKLQVAVRAVIAFLVGVPGALMVPFVGWLYGWYGLFALAGLSGALAYVHGAWSVRRHNILPVLALCQLTATVPLMIAVWAIIAYANDPGGWAELIIAATNFCATWAAAQRRARASSD